MRRASALPSNKTAAPAPAKAIRMVSDWNKRSMVGAMITIAGRANRHSRATLPTLGFPGSETNTMAASESIAKISGHRNKYAAPGR